MQANCIASAVLFSCLLLAASLWDIKKRIIPDSLCLGIVAVGFFAFSPMKLLGILPSLLLLLSALIRKGGMGGGDIKLTAASGFVLGLPAASVGLTIGLALAALFYFATIFIRELKKTEGQMVGKTALPLVPFLSIGFLGAMLFKLCCNL